MLESDARSYLKKWLSRADLKDMREGNNSRHMVISQDTVRRIMLNPKQDFVFFTEMMERAKANEKIYNEYIGKVNSEQVNAEAESRHH